jgi:hypothetical protein
MGTDATSFEDEDLEDSPLAVVADVPAEPGAPGGAATAESELALEAGAASPESAEATGDATGSSATPASVPEESPSEDLFLDDGAAISVPPDSLLEDLLLENVAADEPETGDLETGDLETGDLETGEAVAAELVVTTELTAELTVELTAETVGEEAWPAEGGSDRVPAGQELAEGAPAHDEGEGPAAESGRTSAVETPVADETPFPFGERRSAARQARKPLPAALQEAVAAGAAQDRGAMASQPTSSSGPQTAKRSKKDPKADAAGSNDPQEAKKPGVIRRYGSAIAIVVLFLAAGGVAAGVAAFHGPVTPPAPPTKAQDRAAAAGAVLGPDQLPASWHLNRAANAAASYGLGSPLVTASLVRAWVAGEQACSADLRAVAAAMTPTVGSVTAVAYSQATTRTPLGASWDIADAVAFHTDSAEVTSDLYRMQSVLSKARARDCVARFWSASLQDKMPGYLVMMTVAPRSMPRLPGKPVGWEMEMQGTATNATSSIPLRFEITSFAAGRAEAYFAVSSDGAALPALTATRALLDLAARVDHAATTDT